MGNITIQGDLTGDVPGGEVGGASNLTTVGAIPYVSSAGTLNQDPTALFWDAANDRLGIGRNNPSTVLHVEAANPAVTVTRTAISNLTIANGGSGVWSYTANGGQGLSFGITGGAEWARLAPSTGNLLIGTTTDDSSNKLQIVGAYQAAFLAASGSNNNFTKIDSVYGARFYQTNASGTVVNIIQSSSSASYFNAGNVLIGTTTDSNFKLDVAASGSAGTARFYGGSGVTASTKVVVQAGGGQSGNLTEWQNAAGSANVAAVRSDGVLANPGVIEVNTGYYGLQSYFDTASSLRLANNTGIAWSSTTSWTGTKDLSLSRASAGVLQVGDGGGNANGYLSAARIGVGTASPAQLLDVTSSGSTAINLETTALNNSAIALRRNGSTIGYMGNLSGVVGVFTGAGSAGVGVFNSTGNVAIGGTTDGNYKLDVQNSGSSGTFRVYDQTATTGVTKAVIRAGAGQSTTNLTEWQNSAGTVLASVFYDGVSLNYTGSSIRVGGNTARISNAGNGLLELGSAGYVGFYAGVVGASSIDTALYRNASGVLEVNNGTAGTYRDILARRHQASGETVASLPAAAAGNAGTISYVTDANATTIGSTVAGGGANKVLVWSNGTAWKIFAN